MKLESIQIVRRKLVIPEPKELWMVDPKERKDIITEAKAVWAKFRSTFGFKVPKNVNGLNFGTFPNDNQKFGKSEELIYGLSLSQSNLSGINVCHWSTPECRANCVGKNGNNNYPSIMRAKTAKTRFLFEHPEETGIVLVDFWMKAQNKGIETGKEIGGRLNVFSDINWIESAPWIFNRFKGVHWFDYTKDFNRISPFENYHLTYSASERTTDDEIIGILEQGKNVAVVFADRRTLPISYLGYTVINGDRDDTRWLDPPGSIVGLKRKGRLKATSPFVRAV